MYHAISEIVTNKTDDYTVHIAIIEGVGGIEVVDFSPNDRGESGENLGCYVRLHGVNGVELDRFTFAVFGGPYVAGFVAKILVDEINSGFGKFVGFHHARKVLDAV